MSSRTLRLRTCDIASCEAMCCHDGVYLSETEEQRLRALVARTPALQSRLPPEFIVDGWFGGKRLGRKTATRPHDYCNPAYPAHFPRTRCVFADAAGLCELQKLGLARGEHPWRYKPFTCWMFPLDVAGDEAVPPSADPKQDPWRAPGYPGYVSVVPCGRHAPGAAPWRAALAAELRHFQQVRKLPEFGSLQEDPDEAQQL